ncbi:MAG: hypothetical protein K2W96_17170 [Gemmataceae bacterium]|nr:hypothetical protein [Gemmataceae bacterium]
MNMNMNPTLEQLKELLRSGDDRAGHHMVWVRRDGEVMMTAVRTPKELSDLEQNRADMQLRYELYERGKGYVGEDAAKDEEYTSRFFASLKQEWEQAKGKPSIPFIEISTDVPGRKRMCPSW